MSELIDRQAALDAVEKNACNTQRIMDAVNNLSPVQPEPHEGYWIRVAGMNECCSACNKYFPLSYFTGRPFDINYCPHCGAKMKGEQNE